MTIAARRSGPAMPDFSAAGRPEMVGGGRMGTEEDGTETRITARNNETSGQIDRS